MCQISYKVCVVCFRLDLTKINQVKFCNYLLPCHFSICNTVAFQIICSCCLPNFVPQTISPLVQQNFTYLVGETRFRNL